MDWSSFLNSIHNIIAVIAAISGAGGAVWTLGKHFIRIASTAKPDGMTLLGKAEPVDSRDLVESAENPPQDPNLKVLGEINTALRFLILLAALILLFLVRLLTF